MKKLIKPAQPRYDNVYFEGMRWLEWIAINEDMQVCIHFQNIDNGVDCPAILCPCDRYKGEDN